MVMMNEGPLNRRMMVKTASKVAAMRVMVVSQSGEKSWAEMVVMPSAKRESWWWWGQHRESRGSRARQGLRELWLPKNIEKMMLTMLDFRWENSLLVPHIFSTTENNNSNNSSGDNTIIYIYTHTYVHINLIIYSNKISILNLKINILKIWFLIDKNNN